MSSAKPDDRHGSPNGSRGNKDTRPGSEKQRGPKDPATRGLESSDWAGQPNERSNQNKSKARTGKNQPKAQVSRDQSKAQSSKDQSSKDSRPAKRPRHQPPQRQTPAGSALTFVPSIEMDWTQRNGQIGDFRAWNSTAQSGATQMNVVSPFAGTEDGVVSLTNNDAAVLHAVNMVRGKGNSNDVLSLHFSVNQGGRPPPKHPALEPGQLSSMLTAPKSSREALREKRKRKREAAQRTGSEEPVEEPVEQPVEQPVASDVEMGQGDLESDGDSAGPSTRKSRKGKNRTRPCANCKRKTHTIQDCIWAKDDGFVHGCPIHNTPKHDVDACTDFQKMDLSSRLKILMHDRANMPQLHTQTPDYLFNLLVEAYENVPDDKRPQVYPWTLGVFDPEADSKQSLYATKIHSEVLRQVQEDWEAKWDVTLLPADPASNAWEKVAYLRCQETKFGGHTFDYTPMDTDDSAPPKPKRTLATPLPRPRKEHMKGRVLETTGTSEGGMSGAFERRGQINSAFFHQDKTKK